MHPPSLLAFALREQLLSFDAIMALARTSMPWDAAQLSWGLASCLEDDQLRALQTALRSRGVEGRAAARGWSPWLAAQDLSGDALPYVNPVLAWAPQCREELAEAIDAVARLGRASSSWFLGFDRWETVFSRDEARELARAALARP